MHGNYSNGLNYASIAQQTKPYNSSDDIANNNYITGLCNHNLANEISQLVNLVQTVAGLKEQEAGDL